MTWVPVVHHSRPNPGCNVQVKDITARQDAVHELMEVAAEAAMEARKVFAGIRPS